MIWLSDRISLNVWQAEEFHPERMLDGKFEALPVRALVP